MFKTCLANTDHPETSVLGLQTCCVPSMSEGSEQKVGKLRLCSAEESEGLH